MSRETRLPRHPPEIIWQWGVCPEYQDKDFLSRVVKGAPSLDAYDVLDLEIRAVDRVWVLLRDAFLPPPVLARVLERIKAQADEWEAGHRAQTLSEVARREQRGHRWRAAACIASAAVRKRDPSRLNVEAAYEQEYQRQLAIIREELDAYLSPQKGSLHA